VKIAIAYSYFYLDTLTKFFHTNVTSWLFVTKLLKKDIMLFRCSCYGAMQTVKYYLMECGNK